MTQFTLFSHSGGPNGWKVAFVLEALGLTYETKYLDFKTGEHKAEAHTKLNPNGRIPTLVDNETGYTLWESGAILVYLVDKYDKDHKISADASKGEDTYKQLQWLFFQASGQGPYFGQAAWFSFFHSEKIPSAVERYQAEVVRVFGVLEAVLSKQEWLVADRPTVADLSFITWNTFGIAALAPPGTDVEAQFPALHAWHEKLHALEYVKAVYAQKEALAK